MNAQAELLRALAVVSETPGPLHRRVAATLGIGGALDREAYTELFVLACHPYESVYLGPEGMLGGEGTDQVVGFYRALGLGAPPEPDHLATLLGLYASLTSREDGEPRPERRAVIHRARRALFFEHLYPWVPVFCDSLRATAAEIGSEPYRLWAGLLCDVLATEAASLGLPRTLPRALRVAPGMPGETEGLHAACEALLSPVRSGMVLTRQDLRRAGKETGVLGRAGERRYTLASMLANAPFEVLSWLAVAASSWERRHLSRSGHRGQVARWWARRAASTSSMLEEMARHAAESRDGRARRLVLE